METNKGELIDHGFLISVKVHRMVDQYKMRDNIWDSIRFAYPKSEVDVTYIGEIENEDEQN